MAASRVKLLWLSPVLALFACDATDARYTRVIDGCGVPYECDITERACQLAVLDVTACARGGDAPALPEVRTISVARFREELEQELAEADVVRTPWDTALEALGLQEPGDSAEESIIDDRVANVGAYYEHASQRITVIDDDAYSERATRMYILSHELTHYLQDRAEPRGLDGFRDDVGPALDNQVAASALIEGDATVTSSRVSGWLRGLQAENLDWDGYFREWYEDTHTRVADSSVPLYSALAGLPYTIGGLHVARTWRDRSRGTVDDLFARPHVRLAEWFAAFTVGTLTELVDHDDPLDCAPPNPPANLERYDWDSFGAAGVFALLSRNGNVSPSASAALAGALRDDLIFVYASSSEEDAQPTPMAVAWRMRFADEATAEQFAAYAGVGLPDAATLEVLGQEVLLTASDRQATALSEAARADCPSIGDLDPRQATEPMMAQRRGATLHGGLVRAGGFEPP